MWLHANAVLGRGLLAPPVKVLCVAPVEFLGRKLVRYYRRCRWHWRVDSQWRLCVNHRRWRSLLLYHHRSWRLNRPPTLGPCPRLKHPDKESDGADNSTIHQGYEPRVGNQVFVPDYRSPQIRLSRPDSCHLNLLLDDWGNNVPAAEIAVVAHLRVFLVQTTGAVRNQENGLVTGLGRRDLHALPGFNTSDELLAVP